MPSSLPLAADRAALSNKISLLIANRSSLLKSLNPTSNASKSARHVADDDDQDLHIGQANHGVGYVPDKAAKETSHNDRLLARRMLGKRGKAESKRKVEDSESEGEGRSSIGRNKRKRPPAEPTQPTNDMVEEPAQVAAEMPRESGELEAEEADTGDAGQDREKRKRKKKKKKKSKNKANQSGDTES